MSDKYQFKGFGLGIGRRANKFLKSRQRTPRDKMLVSHEKCREMLDVGSPEKFLNAVTALTAYSPEANTFLVKWLRASLERKDHRVFEEAATVIARALGAGHPSVKMLVPDMLELTADQAASEDIAEVDVVSTKIEPSDPSPAQKKEPVPISVVPDARAVVAQKVSPTPFLLDRQPSPLVKVDKVTFDQLLAYKLAADRTDNPVASYVLFCTRGGEAQRIRDRKTEGSGDPLIFVETIIHALNSDNPSSVYALLASTHAYSADESADIFVAILSRLKNKGRSDGFVSAVNFIVGLSGGDVAGLSLIYGRAASELNESARAYFFQHIVLLKQLHNEQHALTIANWVDLGTNVETWYPSDQVIILDMGPELVGANTAIFSKLMENISFRSVFLKAAQSDAASDVLYEIARRVSANKKLSYEARSVAIVAQLYASDPRAALSGVARLKVQSADTIASDAIIDWLKTMPIASKYVGRLTPVLKQLAASSATRAKDLLRELAMMGARDSLLAVLTDLAINFKEWAPVASAVKCTYGPKVSSTGKASILVTDLAIPAAGYGGFGLRQGAEVFHVNGTTPDSVTELDGIVFREGKKINDDQVFIRQLTHLSETIAYSLSTRFRATLRDSDLQDAFSDLHAALFASARARLIGIFRRYEIRNYWRRSIVSGSEKVILTFRSPVRLREVLRDLGDDPIADQLEISCLPATVSEARAFLAIMDQWEADRFRPPEDPYSLEPTRRIEIETQLKKLMRAQMPVISSGKKDDRLVLFVNRMAAKTVPGTVLPVMSRALEDQDVYLLDIQTSKDVDFKFDIETSGSATLHYHSTKDIRANVKSKNVGEEDTIALWFNTLFSRTATSILGEENIKYENEIKENGLGFDCNSMAYLLTLRISYEALMKERKTGVVFVSPGRSVEAYCAQEMAARRGLLSVDITNAWMSKHYTYARPRGDIVTALDHFTSDLLSDAFGIDQSNVDLLGTPRFDGVRARVETLDRKSLLDQFNLDPSLPTICVAFQPLEMTGNLDTTQAIMDALGDKRRANVIIKPHPREKAERLQRYKDTIDNHPNSAFANTVYLPHADIIDVLVASDLCLTSFSNVGVEAALCDRDTIIVQYESMKVPLKLDELGLGVAVYDREGLSAAICDVLDGGDLVKEIRRRRKEFFKKNPHYPNGNARDAIYALSADKSRIGEGRERPLVLL